MNLMLSMVVGIIQGALLSALVFLRLRSGMRKSGDFRKNVDFHIKELEAANQSLADLVAGLANKVDLDEIVGKLESLEQALQIEKGRVTITYAELETVETRLRELHEIEREIQASTLETQEELRILEAREKELLKRSESLRMQLESSNQQIEMLASELNSSPEVKAEVEKVQRELDQAQSKMEEIAREIEKGNKLFVSLKRQYDALDIEYAQLYQKYAMSVEQAAD